ncbi:hypothetical protein HQ524_02610 [Candidatus Uhrbacteria bacterium]|nr:hypothetical protein [Candidatus Uhrbacteria bacterium]
MIFLIFSSQWVKTGNASDTSSVGAGTQLADNVVAVASFYDTANEQPFLNRVKAHLLINKSANTVALLSDGSIVEIPDDNIANFVTNRSRPYGWFIPGTLGVVNFQSNSGQIVSSRLTGSNTRIKLSDRNKDALIASLIPDTAMYGAHIDCGDECPSIDINDVNIEYPEALGETNFFSMAIDSDMESLFVFNDVSGLQNDLELFARQILERAFPMVIERVLEGGVTIQELVPGNDIKVEHYGGIRKFGEGNTALYLLGDIVKGNAIQRYLSTTDSVFSNASHLSTQSWTTKICGVKPSYFFAISFSATFAENPNAPLYVVRSKDGWRICER